MDEWHGDDKWLDCNTIEEIHQCDTTFCIVGWAGIEYFIEHKKECKKPKELYPNLNHLFYMNTDKALEEIKKIIR